MCSVHFEDIDIYKNIVDTLEEYEPLLEDRYRLFPAGVR